MADGLEWHYGPTKWDPEPGKMWCSDCGAEVWTGRDGTWCTGCGQEEDCGGRDNT